MRKGIRTVALSDVARAPSDADRQAAMDGLTVDYGPGTRHLPLTEDPARLLLDTPEPTLDLPVPGQGYALRVLRFVLIAVFVVGCLAYIVIRYRRQAGALHAALGACVRKVHADAMRKALLGEEDTRQSWRGLRGSCEAAGDGFGGWRRALHGR